VLILAMSQAMYTLLGIIFFVIVGFSVILWWKKRVSRGSREVLYYSESHITLPQRIGKILNMAIKEKTPVTVSLGEGRQNYTSYFLRIQESPKVTEVYIDKLVPDEGNLLIGEFKKAHFTFILYMDEFGRRNIPYETSMNFIREEGSQALKQLVFEFPKELFRRQRREYLRVYPPEKQPVTISFQLEGVEQRAQVWDISGGGISFLTDINENRLAPNTELKDVVINIPGLPVIRTVAIVHKKTRLRTHITVEGKRMNYLCGAKFKDIAEEARDLIIKYVVSVEREELRRLKGSPMAEEEII